MQMSHKNGLKIALILAFTLSLLGSSLHASGLAVRSVDDFYIVVNDASYGDFDGDGLEDDCYIVFDLVVPEKKGTIWVDIYLDLVLPSGFTHSAYFLVKVGVTVVPTLIIHAYDTAIEPGWYDAQLLAIATGFQPAYSYTSYIFDPPGIGAGDPYYTIMVL